MKFRLLWVLALIAVPTATMADETTVTNCSYACADNEVPHVVYQNGAGGKSFAIVQQLDEMISMVQEVSASGAVHKEVIPNHSYRLLTKGKEASLQDGKGTILSDCST